jgi:hypothetical protein
MDGRGFDAHATFLRLYATFLHIETTRISAQFSTTTRISTKFAKMFCFGNVFCGERSRFAELIDEASMMSKG